MAGAAIYNTRLGTYLPCEFACLECRLAQCLHVGLIIFRQLCERRGNLSLLTNAHVDAGILGLIVDVARRVPDIIPKTVHSTLRVLQASVHSTLRGPTVQTSTLRDLVVKSYKPDTSGDRPTSFKI